MPMASMPSSRRPGALLLRQPCEEGGSAHRPLTLVPPMADFYVTELRAETLVGAIISPPPSPPPPTRLIARAWSTKDLDCHSQHLTENLLGDDDEEAELAVTAWLTGKEYKSETNDKSPKVSEEEFCQAVHKVQAQRLCKQAEKAASTFVRERGFSGISFPRRRGLSIVFPLHCAVEENRPAMVWALLLAGADRSCKNSFGKTALDIANKLNSHGSHDEIVRMLGR